MSLGLVIPSVIQGLTKLRNKAYFLCQAHGMFPCLETSL